MVKLEKFIIAKLNRITVVLAEHKDGRVNVQVDIAKLPDRLCKREAIKKRLTIYHPEKYYQYES